MIEQLKPQNAVLPNVFDDGRKQDKRIPITEELMELANMQEGLEKERDRLKQSVQSATDLLVPLRAQMQDVIACMKRFHEMENSYVALSRQTYRDIAADMNVVGKEIEQTKGLLLEGTRLAEAGIDLSQLRVAPCAALEGQEKEEKKEEKEGVGKEIEAEEEKQTEMSASEEHFWDAVDAACKGASFTTGEEGTAVRILLARDDAAMHPDLRDTVLSNMSDTDVLRVVLHDYADGTSTLTAELTDTAEICSMPFPEVFGKDGLGMAAREKLMDDLYAAITKHAQQTQDYDPGQPESNFDGLLDELGVD